MTIGPRGFARRLDLHAVCVTVVALSVSLFSGCSFGPGQLKQGHLAYNTAVKQAADDELLLNIVRLRYLDSLDFMATTSVTSQLSFAVGLGAAGGRDGGGNTRLGSAELAYSTTPTFSFIPQRGRDFARQLVKPVNVDILTYLIAADWDMNVLMRLFVRELNDLENELGLPNPQFRRVMEILSDLQLHNDVFVGFVEQTDVLSDPVDPTQVSGSDLVEAAREGFRFRRDRRDDRLVLTVSRPQAIIAFPPGQPEVAELKRLLDLPSGEQEFFNLEEGTTLNPMQGGYSSIQVRTRALIGALVYLSQGVDVPEAHVEQGLTTAEWPPESPGLNMSDFFRMQVSETAPDAQLAVQHRGYWFYIPDSDIASRYVFYHLAGLFRLGLSQTAPQEAPVLTLPVGGP